MTFEIALVLAILGAAVVLFITERLRIDLVALLVLGSLALTGLVTPAEALSGFSSPAVVTVWAMFILSAGLSRTGVARIIGRQVFRLAGTGEARLVAVIMLTAGLMSAFMNNIGVAALLLPVVMDLGRRTGNPPSKLLMPLAFGSLLGGLTTLIGTPPNILVSDALAEYGLLPFGLFDFAPVGLAVMLAGMAYVVLAGRRLLPVRDLEKELTGSKSVDLKEVYELTERMFIVNLPPDSTLAGKTLASSRLGSALGLNVIGILRNGRTLLSPDPGTPLQARDRLMMVGRPERLANLVDYGQLQIEQAGLDIDRLVSTEIRIAKVGLAPHSPLIGHSLREVGFRRRFGVNVLSIWQAGVQRRTKLQDLRLRAADILVVQGPHLQIEKLHEVTDFLISDVEEAEISHLHERLLVVRIPADSPLAGKSLAESHLGDALGLTVLGIVRAGSDQLAPEPAEKLQVDDILLVEGNPEELESLSSLQDLEIERELLPGLPDLETEQVGLAEVVLSPHTTLVDKTLREIHFREKYGLSVLAIWRNGRAFRSNLRDMPLHLGDALLLFGPREKMILLGREPDFLVLKEEAQEIPRVEKAPLAAVLMALILIPVLLGWTPIAIAAVTGAALMVLTGCLSMDEAYRAIEWKAVFLIAGMLPLGAAMEQTGAARMLAEGVVTLTGSLGPLAVIAGLFVLTSATAQTMPTAAVAVLLAPVALNTAQDLGLSPYALLMTVAIAASTSFMSPVSHPANVLVMGPGGYRFSDYIKLGLPLVLVTLIVVLLVLPVFWPLGG